MIEINFLPWRTQQLLFQRKKLYALLFLSVALTFLMGISVHFFLMKKITLLNAQVSEIKIRLDSRLENKLTDPHQAIIQRLLTTQSHAEKLIRALANAGNRVVCFTDINKDENRINFLGNARSMSDLTAFIKHWRAADLFSYFRFVDFKDQPTDQSIYFHFYGSSPQ